MQDVALFFVIVVNDCCPHSLAGTCTYQYILEPWTNPELASCNPHGSHDLTTVCSVTGSGSSFTLVWYYSKSSSNAGRSGRILNNIGENYFLKTDEPDKLINGAFRMSSHLTIMNVTENEFGYYWCMVRVRNSDMFNPSRILHLSNICASDPVCNSSLQLYQQWQNNSCVDNKNITLPETLQCNQPTSTPDNVASIQPTRTEHLMNSSATLPLQTVTVKSGVIRAPSLEDKMKTSIDLLSSHSTIVYTEPLPTDVLSGGDSDTRLIWLYVGIAMAVVLTAIAVILTLIICIQCKKWGVKGV